jgi:hypothetical protein
VRAATNVALRALGSSLVIQEMLRGTPVIYMDYTDYDEIAHHSGPERPESLDALDGVDRELGILRKAAEEGPRPYRFVILADHGQSLGQTFLQRYGVTIQDVIRSLMGGKASVAAATAQIEDWGQLNTFLGEVSQTGGVTGSLARAVSRDRRSGTTKELGPDSTEFTPAGAATATTGAPGATDAGTDDARAATADLVVVAGGNLALAYFGTSDGRMTLEEIEAAYPDLVQALANHPGVGILMVRTAEHGPVAVGRSGIHHLADGRVSGDDPLLPYGDLARSALLRLDGIEHVGDIALVSLYDPETGEIAAFEELIGAHGGLGGAQTRPFLLYPSDWELDLAPLVGAPMVYRQLRTWMERELGLRFGRQADRPADGAPPLAGASAPAAAAAPPAASGT